MKPRGATRSSVRSRSAKETGSSSAVPKVVFVLGAGRSGTTVLGNMLGQVDGYVNVGELRRIWLMTLEEGRLCGCGRPLRECPFWSAVLAKVVGSDGRPLDPAETARWQRESLRLRHMSRILRAARHGQAASGALRASADAQGRLYSAIADVSGARVIVDTSKTPSSGALLALVPQIEPFFLHLVRDPRAVSYSWSRHKVRPDGPTPGQMPRYGSAASAADWAGYNGVSEILARRVPPGRYARLTYEAFVADPRDALLRVANLCGEDAGDLSFIDGRIAHLVPNHTVAGNPNRFRLGDVELNTDDEWRRRMSTAGKAVITALTLPFTVRYGYELWPKRERTATPPRPASSGRSRTDRERSTGGG